MAGIGFASGASFGGSSRPASRRDRLVLQSLEVS
jgi:hypothetical protein